MAPLSKWAGFRTDMDMDDFVRDTGLEVVETRSVNVFGYWKLLRCRNASHRALVA